jgi:hypothetical protein
MKNKFFLFLAIVSFGLISNDAFAQCGVLAKASKLNVICGESISLSAISNGLKPLNNDFNLGIGPWAATSGGVVTDGSGTFSCMGPAPDPPNYFFMGSTTNTPRALQSNSLDLTQGGAIGANICFYMKYSSQGQTGTCEGPDATGEGVYLEYSTNCATWTQIQYWDPNGGNDPTLTSWNQYCLNVPAAALSPNTCFRWVQKNSSGASFDTWAIDKVEVILIVPGYLFDWKHDTQSPATTSATPNVTPTAKTTYVVTYSNKGSGGTDTCTSNVVVDVTIPQVTTSPASPICPGGTTTLVAISPYQSVPPTSCGLAPLPQTCDPISEKLDLYQIGTGNTVNAYNSNTLNTFGDFGATNSNARTQIILRAAELLASGLKAGKIRSISFDIARLDDVGSYTDFSIYIACNAKNVFANSTDFVPLASLNLVYGPKTQSPLFVGWNEFTFDKDYNWDGVSNIVIQVCWTVASSSVSLAAKTRDHASGFNSCIQAVNNTFNYSATVCQSASTFGKSSTNRPNIKLLQCQAKTVTMVYNWSPAATLTNSTSRTPLASPTINTIYTVTAYASPFSQCASTANVNVPVNVPTVNITPPFPSVCRISGSGMPSYVTITANANSTGGNTIAAYSWSPALGLSSTTISNPNASPTQTSTYKVVVTDNQGCTASNKIEVGYCIILSKDFLTFQVNSKSGFNQLTWMIDPKKSKGNFVIQKSTNGMDFKSIHEMRNVNFLQGNNLFSYADFDIANSKAYYRIVLDYMEGNLIYSEPRSLIRNNPNAVHSLEVYPNPVQNELNIQFLDGIPSESNEFDFYVLGSDGKIVYSQKFIGNNQIQNFKLNVSEFAQGVYLVKINLKGKPIAQTKFIKLE